MKNFLLRNGTYILVIGLALILFLYTHDLTENPPGFYVDESAFAYNAYTIAKTGASEFGVRWPLFFQNFEPPYTIFVNPVHIYLLAALFVFFPPSILLARSLSAIAGFEAGMLIGLLAFKISGKRWIGIVVGITTLITPWFFEFSRWFSDASYYPLALALLLLSVHRASLKERWAWSDVLCIALSLGLVTYTYSIGRLLGPMLAFGLISFAVNKRRLDVLKTWLAYGLTLIPYLIFYLRHPQALSSRFAQLSYLRTETTLQGVLLRFITRYFQDLSLFGLLIRGDLNPRHHVPGATGSMLWAPFFLALLGFGLVVFHRRQNPWWGFIIWSTFCSVIPGALTVDAFHTGRMIAYPVFLMVLTIPAMEWLTNGGSETFATDGPGWTTKWTTPSVRRWALIILVLAIVAQATYFQVVFWHRGYERYYAWDAPYKEVYDMATQMPSRPIYLSDGYWGPAYIHAFWYATLEGRSTSEFVHLPYRAEAPSGATVISSDVKCIKCVVLLNNGEYMLYRKL